MAALTRSGPTPATVEGSPWYPSSSRFTDLTVRQILLRCQGVKGVGFLRTRRRPRGGHPGPSSHAHARERYPPKLIRTLLLDWLLKIGPLLPFTAKVLFWF